MFFDGECLLCDRPAGRSGICPDCRAGLGPAPPLGPPPGLDACRALTAYRATGRALVHRVKFHGRHGVIAAAAGLLAAEVHTDAVEVVTWAPTTPARRRRRGYDQAELLARALARDLGVPARRCLRRLPGPAQTGRQRSERLLGPRFDPHRGIRQAVAGRRVALVDDVVTTGATLRRATEVLRSHGAVAVVGVVLARTPDAASRPAGSATVRPRNDPGARRVH